jgi:hypothetical protein
MSLYTSTFYVTYEYHFFPLYYIIVNLSGILLPWIRSPDRPARSQSLYRLSYPHTGPVRTTFSKLFTVNVNHQHHFKGNLMCNLVEETRHAHTEAIFTFHLVCEHANIYLKVERNKRS